MEKKISVGVIPMEGELLYIKEDNNEVGCVHLIFTPDYLVVHSIEIQPKHRGKGYSKVLLDNVIHRAKLSDYCLIHLQCHKDNVVANNLYISYGFIAIDVDELDNVLYQKQLCEPILNEKKDYNYENN